jgi:hypothetical protein
MSMLPIVAIVSIVIIAQVAEAPMPAKPQFNITKQELFFDNIGDVDADDDLELDDGDFEYYSPIYGKLALRSTPT